MPEKVSKKEMKVFLVGAEVASRRSNLSRNKTHRDKVENEDDKTSIIRRERKRNQASNIQAVQKTDRGEPEKVVRSPLLLDKSKKEGPDKTTAKNILPLYKRAEMLKERVRMINYDGNLYYYNGRCYDIIDSKDIIRLYRERVDNTLSGERNMNNIMQLHQFLSTDTDISVTKYVSNQRIAVLNNGIFDVMKQTLYAHTPKIITFSYIDADYIEGERCKYFDAFLRTVTYGNPILINRIWSVLGYIFMQTTEAKVFFIMGEAPDSGKSLLGNFIESVFPRKYVSNVALNDFNKDFSIAPIVGSAINVSLDLPSSRLNSVAVSKLKMLTGGDALNINQKYVPQFRYENRAKFIFASNSPIYLTEQDNAFWRRLVYLPFNRTIPKEKQNTELLSIFQREKNAIVSKALYYAKELIQAGFEFPSTPEIELKMQEWQGISCKTIENFIKECCKCSPEYRGELMDNLYSEYEKYCDYIGFVPKSRNLFKRFLEEQIGLQHFKMRDGGINPRSAFKGILLNENIG